MLTIDEMRERLVDHMMDEVREKITELITELENMEIKMKMSLTKFTEEGVFHPTHPYYQNKL